jgi:hypothetical protein
VEIIIIKFFENDLAMMTSNSTTDSDSHNGAKKAIIDNGSRDVIVTKIAQKIAFPGLSICPIRFSIFSCLRM